MSGNLNYRMPRKITTIITLQGQKSLLERYGLENGCGGSIIDRKPFRIFHKATIIRGVSEMIWDINGAPVKAIMDLLKWKEFFEAKLNHDASVVLI
ncbi:unnamed protein product [Dracunculus medinensis]|uniref:DUF4283 domain-containing protein n=1 Tax=Dracunculus medinensis TaxID=318479 RepID=A0A0N4UNF4_DRAME|nr:unnamed protein product [Dracunculus medinensis]